MATFTKSLLSGSTDGMGVKVASAYTPMTVPGTTVIHQAVSGTSSLDEIWLYAINTSASDVTLGLQWGGGSMPDDVINITLPAYGGLTMVAPGLLLNNSQTVYAGASTLNVVMIHGYVNRIA